jgi:hypothetical protein
MSSAKERVIKLVNEVIHYDFNQIIYAVSKSINAYKFEDLDTLDYEESKYVYYLNDIIYFINKSNNKSDFVEYFREWKDSNESRYKIAGK